MKRYLLFLIVACSFFNVFAQRQAENWYFGLNAGLNFNSGSPVAVNDGALSTTEGCSTISDDQGNLLFYTDGVTVYNRQHTAMSNSGDLTGDVSTTQSALIVPKPGVDSTYYIFTLPPDGSPGFRYSVVDLTLDNGLGDVTAEKNVLVQNDVAEKVSAVNNHDGTGYWVMVHEYPGDGFYAYLLTTTGLSNTPVISHTGTVHEDTVIQNSYGYMKFSPSAEKLGLAIGYQGLYEVFDFNDTTGVVSNPMTFSTGDRVYGLEFSGDNSKLYTTHHNLFTDLYYLDQYDLSSGIEATINASKVTLANPEGARALQLGPDGKMYLAKAFQSSLGVINYPDSLGTDCDFQDFAISLDLGTCAIGLPGFIQSYFKDKGAPISAFSTGSTTTCANSCITFNNLSLNSPHTFEWHFEGAEPDTSFLENPGNICYENPGDYDVTLITTSNMGFDTLTLTDYIHVGTSIASPTVNLFGSTFNSSAATSYQWYRDSVLIPDAINQVYTATQDGSYYVVVTNAGGCMASSVPIDFTVGIEILQKQDQLKVFPVPATDELILELPYNWSAETEIIIYTVTGERIKPETTEIKNNRMHLNIRNLSSGLYSVRCISGPDTFHSQFIRK